MVGLTGFAYEFPTIQQTLHSVYIQYIENHELATANSSHVISPRLSDSRDNCQRSIGGLWDISARTLPVDCSDSASPSSRECCAHHHELDNGRYYNAPRSRLEYLPTLIRRDHVACAVEQLTWLELSGEEA